MLVAMISMTKLELLPRLKLTILGKISLFKFTSYSYYIDDTVQNDYKGYKCFI